MADGAAVPHPPPDQVRGRLSPRAGRDGAWCQVLGAEDRPEVRQALRAILASERTARDRLGGDVVAELDRSERGRLIVTWRRAN